MSAFSDKLRDAIDNCGVPVADLARDSGMSASMLYKIQSGSRLPDGIETLSRLLDAMLCALPLKLDLIHAYRMERIGPIRYQCFMDFKDMLGEMTAFRTVKADRTGSIRAEFPMTIYGNEHINAAIRSMLEEETMREGGVIDLQVPFRNTFCLSYLSQVLLDCNPKFDRVRHIFALKAGAADSAMVHNMSAIRSVLPRLLSMAHYDPWYCYLEDPDDTSTSMFSYSIITSTAVLLITPDFQYGIYLTDPQACQLYRRRFEVTLSRYHPLMRGGKGGYMDFLMYYARVQERLSHPPRPVTLAAEPCILSCIPLDTMRKYVPEQLFERPQVMQLVTMFYEQSAANGHTTYFTMDGLMNLLNRGQLTEIQGTGIPAIDQADVYAGVVEMLRRARRGNITLCLFRENLFPEGSRLSMALYDPTTLFVGCEVPERNGVFADINEASLCRVFREYTENALLLGDIHTPEESIIQVEQALQRYRRRNVNLPPLEV